MEAKLSSIRIRFHTNSSSHFSSPLQFRVHVFLAKCLSMRETKGIVVSSAPRASTEQWQFGTSRYELTPAHLSLLLIKHVPALMIVFLPPQSLEASIQGLRIMWRNLVTEWRDAAASLLNHALTFDLPRPPPSHLTHCCGTARNTHNWPPYWVSAKALIRPSHTLVGVCKH